MQTNKHAKTWKGMEGLLRPSYGTRFIGVSNFAPAQLDDLLAEATVLPKAVQIELHPYLPQSDYVDTIQKRGITVIAYAPLGNTNPMYEEDQWEKTGIRAPKLLLNKAVNEVAQARGCSPAQAVLAWNLHRKVVVIPKAAKPEHQVENIATVDKCKLTEDDIRRLSNLEVRLRVCSMPCRSMNFRCFDGLAGGPY
jgi:alcohol dehydrogenase (NADP+)